MTPRRLIGLGALLGCLAIACGATGTARSPASNGSSQDRARADVDGNAQKPASVAPDSVAPEPSSEADAAHSGPSAPCAAQIGGSEHCFINAEEACAAIDCPRESCTYLYGGGRAQIQVACERKGD